MAKETKKRKSGIAWIVVVVVGLLLVISSIIGSYEEGYGWVLIFALGMSMIVSGMLMGLMEMSL